ncbi:MAG: metal ABC transporter ATP-binding protein [Paracoccaceae bacterium]|nr:metal ABC transporter ATP-binding protein [Paracoccaceae bacterium]
MRDLPEAPPLAVEDLTISHRGRPILDGVSFALNRGELCGLIGANGSGKTTLLRAILGLARPDGGQIRFGGGRRGRIGYLPQKVHVDAYMPLRARDVVALGLDGHRIGLPLPSAQRRARVAAALDAVSAEGFADQRVGTLSGGQQQRVFIAHALVRAPDVLLLDEPLASLDPSIAAEIAALLRRISQQMGIAVLLSAHEVNTLVPVMDKVIYLANRHAVAGLVAEVIRSDVLSRLYGHHIDVLNVHGRILVVTAPDAGAGTAHVTLLP